MPSRILERSIARWRKSSVPGLAYHLHASSSALYTIHHSRSWLSCVQEFGKTKIYTALQEAHDDLSKEVQAYLCWAGDCQ